MVQSPELQRRLAVLITPTADELLSARAVILNLLEDGASHHENEFVSAAWRDRGIRVVSSHEPMAITSADGTELTGEEPQLAGPRVRYAVRDALAELVRDGEVHATAGNASSVETDSIHIRHVSGSTTTTGGVRVAIHHAALGPSSDCRWRLTHRPDSPRLKMARTDLTTGLDDLLGARGLEVLQEAVQCFHRGRFLAAVDLLAAASEAAWFGVASAASGADAKLDRLVASGEMISEVIERTTNVLSARRALSSTARNDLRAQAARFRDLRNYGLHPVGDPDQDREGAFTEPGAAVLFITARRYLQQLDDARRAVSQPN